MSKFQVKAEAQAKQIIGQMLGDDLLVEEGKEQLREASEPESSTGGQDDKKHDQALFAMNVDKNNPATRIAPSG
jgi:hypothetical protein